MTPDEQALRELLERAAPDLGTFDAAALTRRSPHSHRTGLAVAGAVAAVVATVLAVAVAIAVIRHSGPSGSRGSAGPVSRPSPGHVSGVAHLRRLVRGVPCPGPTRARVATRAQLAAFPAVAAVTCSYAERTYPGQGEWSVRITRASATRIAKLKAAFLRPDARSRRTVVCFGVLITGAPVLFVDAAGRYIEAAYPIERTCGQPLPATLRAVGRQPWHPVASTRVHQDRTPAEVATGCADRIKDVVGLDVQFGVSASPGGPVFTYHPQALLTACIYFRSPRDPEAGDFVRGVRLDGRQSDELRASLTGPGPTGRSCAAQDAFASISTRGGDTVYLELGGCWRLHRDDAHAALGTADAAVVRRLLNL